jgi:hypothetical protein
MSGEVIKPPKNADERRFKDVVLSSAVIYVLLRLISFSPEAQ